ncbi:hypothetical protein [Streptomyces sp. 8K308]|uniref:hypothetical protein n=1 Tax=Streptomyces sp. 8K308 TaxID=2530388 RepID=UPI00140526EF|nr:hypothetical protein [Streptomyces sp. 8K308]
MNRRTTLHGFQARQGVRLNRPRTVCEDRKDNLVRTVDVHHARSLPPRARAAVVPLVVIIVVAVFGASLVGHGTAALIAVVTTLLAAAVQELLRAAMRHWTRVA